MLGGNRREEIKFVARGKIGRGDTICGWGDRYKVRGKYRRWGNKTWLGREIGGE